MNAEWFLLYDNVSNVSFNNINPYWLQFPPASATAHTITTAFIIIVIFLSVLGNGLVIAVCLKSFRYKDFALSNPFIINLAISDIVNPLVTYWMMVVSSQNGIWAFGRTGCSIYGFLQGYFGLMSLITTSALSVNICGRILKRSNSPMIHFQESGAIILLGSIWIYCLILTSPPLFGWSSYTPAGFLTTCCFDYITTSFEVRMFIVFLFGFGFVTPFMALLLSYLVVLKNVRWVMKKIDNDHRSIWSAYHCDSYRRTHGCVTMSRKDRNVLKRQMRLDLKVLRIVFTVVLTFLVSWTPYAIVALMGQFGPKNLITPLMATVPAIFAKSSTVYNPFIYAYKDTKFRRAAIHFIYTTVWNIRHCIK